MKYLLKRPCPHCPFRSDIPGYLRGDRAREIAEGLLNGGDFPCHETTKFDEEDGEAYTTPDSLHCAGALIMMECGVGSNQLMRIAERLGMYDPSTLDMDAPVFGRIGDFVAHHARATKRGKDLYNE